MRWHANKVEPRPEKSNSHFIVKTDDNRYVFVLWDACAKRFYNDTFMGALMDIEKWCYVEEDDCNTDEIVALNAIQDAVSHVESLYNLLLTDGICCGKEYRDLIGLNELQIIKEKLIKRILELDTKE